jgi:3-keto-5-aminohexanoate cleavage enzyme
MEKLVITAALSGGLTMREQNPNVPYTPQEIARAAIDAWKAGASMVHLHVRDPQTGACVQEAELFREAISTIRRECDLIINVTTGGAPKMPLEERIAIIPQLSSDPKVKPDMASLNCGSLNFGLLSSRKREFILNDVMLNPFATILHYADTMKTWGVKPELEVYDVGMINNALVIHSLGALPEPLHFSFVLGVLGALPATIDNLIFLKNTIPRGAIWSICAVGLPIFTLAPVAIGLGGHVRVGLEDCVRISKESLADSSAQMVEKIVRLASEMDREIATPAEARRILNLL